MSSKIYAAIAGVGHYAPEKVLTNADLEKLVDTSDEWIQTRTGIRERRIAAADETSSAMGTAAARLALERAGIAPADVEAIYVATCTPDMIFPSTACLIQAALGAKRAYGFDVSSACAGFMMALDAAACAIETGRVRNALVVGAAGVAAAGAWPSRPRTESAYPHPARGMDAAVCPRPWLYRAKAVRWSPASRPR